MRLRGRVSRFDVCALLYPLIVALLAGACTLPTDEANSLGGVEPTLAHEAGVLDISWAEPASTSEPDLEPIAWRPSCTDHYEQCMDTKLGDRRRH